MQRSLLRHEPRTHLKVKDTSIHRAVEGLEGSVAQRHDNLGLHLRYLLHEEGMARVNLRLLSRSVTGSAALDGLRTVDLSAGDACELRDVPQEGAFLAGKRHIV